MRLSGSGFKHCLVPLGDLVVFLGSVLLEACFLLLAFFERAFLGLFFSRVLKQI